MWFERCYLAASSVFLKSDSDASPDFIFCSTQKFSYVCISPIERCSFIQSDICVRSVLLHVHVTASSLILYSITEGGMSLTCTAHLPFVTPFSCLSTPGGRKKKGYLSFCPECVSYIRAQRDWEKMELFCKEKPLCRRLLSSVWWRLHGGPDRGLTSVDICTHRSRYQLSSLYKLFTMLVHFTITSYHVL